MNFILLNFSFMAYSMIVYGTIMCLYENKLPSLFAKIFRYGKFKYKGNLNGLSSKVVLEIPKSSFRHFYWVGILAYTFILYSLTSLYLFNQGVPDWLILFLNNIGGINRIAYVSATRVYLATLLMTVQVYRRFYDTHFVSVFSKNARINLCHYLLGIIHYPGSALAIICEAPNIAINSSYAQLNINFFELTYTDLFAIVLFLWAWWHQFTTTAILADLRKNKKGIVVTDEHRLPHGDWFEYFSAPHQIAEILMYFSVTVLLWYNITWFFVFAWVLSNQVVSILFTHWWYQETFANFPKSRKALIPFIY